MRIISLKKSPRYQIGVKRIGLAAILFGLYTAMIPLNQIMNIKGSGTANKYLGIVVAGAVLLSMVQKKESFNLNRQHLSFLVFAMFALLSYFWSINQNVTLGASVSIISLIIFYIVCSNRTFTDPEKTFLKICCIFGGLIVSLYLISTSDLYYTRVFIRTTSGQEADPNGLSSSLAFGGLILLDYLLRGTSKVKSALILICIAVIIYGMLLTGSRGGMLGLILGSIMLVMWATRIKKISKTKLLSFSLIVALLLVTILGTGILSKYINTAVLDRLSVNNALETGGSNRTMIWASALEATVDSPIIGYGFATGPYVLVDYYGEFRGTHNVVFYILLGSGLIGLIIMTYCIARIVKSSIKKKDALTLSMMVMLIAFCGTLDYLMNKNFWNVMIYSQIGLGVSQAAYQKRKITP